MSNPLNKEALLRSAWLTALRTQGDRQCIGASMSHTQQHVCAMVLLTEILGLPWHQWGARACFEAAGLTAEQAHIVMCKNDGRGVVMVEKPWGTHPERITMSSTFAEIADVVESWFTT